MLYCRRRAILKGDRKMKSKIVEIDGKLYMTVGGVVLYEIERTEETNEQEIDK